MMKKEKLLGLLISVNEVSLLFIGLGGLLLVGCDADISNKDMSEQSLASSRSVPGVEKIFASKKIGDRKFEADIGVLQDLVGGEIAIKIAIDTVGLEVDETESDCSCFKAPRVVVGDEGVTVIGSIYPRKLREDFIFNPSILVKTNRGTIVLLLKGRLVATFPGSGPLIKLSDWVDLRKKWDKKITLESSYDLPEDMEVESSNPDIKVAIDSVEGKKLVVGLQTIKWTNLVNLETEITVLSSHWRVPFTVECAGEIFSDVKIDDRNLNVGIVEAGSIAVGEAMVSHKKMGVDFLLKAANDENTISIRSVEPGVFRVRISTEVDGKPGTLFQKTNILKTNDSNIPAINLRLRGIVRRDNCCQ